MGNVLIANESNLILNTALCVVIRYYEANQVLPGTGGKWTGVGNVWFTVAMVPWYGPDSKFEKPTCIETYNDYVNRIPHIASNVTQFGSADLGYVKVTGHNITQAQAEERLYNLVYWGDGFKVIGKKLTFAGGPPARLVRRDPHEIDISEHFEQVQLIITAP